MDLLLCQTNVVVSASAAENIGHLAFFACCIFFLSAVVSFVGPTLLLFFQGRPMEGVPNGSVFDGGEGGGWGRGTDRAFETLLLCKCIEHRVLSVS